MITPERIAEIEGQLIFPRTKLLRHSIDCAEIANQGLKCDCAYGLARELLSELKDSLSREKKHQEEIARFASKLTEWIEDQIA